LKVAGAAIEDTIGAIEDSENDSASMTTTSIAPSYVLLAISEASQVVSTIRNLPPNPSSKSFLSIKPIIDQAV
jgi:hypothetical protein